MKDKEALVTGTDKIVFSSILVLAALLFIFWKDVRATFKSTPAVTEPKEKNKKDKKGTKENAAYSNSIDKNISVLQKWNMPDVLKEISGIDYINKDQFACVQDELGKVFIFNIATASIVKEIEFAASGDYEGIAIAGKDAYVVRADGKILEVSGYNNANPVVTQYSTHLTLKNNVEGLCYDKKNNRLLLAIKGRELSSNDYKGIYAFDLSSKKIIPAPVYKIDLTDKIWAGSKGKNKIQPSDLAVHPITGDIYIIEGTSPKLLVMSADGSKKSLYPLGAPEFSQPEGISFTPSGELFISNEGTSNPGNILKVAVTQ